MQFMRLCVHRVGRALHQEDGDSLVTVWAEWVCWPIMPAISLMCQMLSDKAVDISLRFFAGSDPPPPPGKQ